MTVTYAWQAVILFTISITTDKLTNGQECKIDKSDCSCKFDDGSGKYIDLSPLANSGSNPNPKFLMPGADDGGYTYAFNPCNSFKYGPSGTGCSNGVMLCQFKKEGNNYFDIGSPNSGTFENKNGIWMLLLTSTGPPNKTSKIQLSCTTCETDYFSAIGEGAANEYNFVLSSQHACVKQGSSSGSSSGLSAGSILDIIFFVLLIVYFVGGALYLGIVRGAKGKEMVPNYEFWADLPALVRDGTLFCVRGCKTEEYYERI